MAPNPHGHPMYRATAAMQSILTNVMTQINYLEGNLQVASDAPTSATKAFTDLLHAAGAPDATLVEGVVVLWAIEDVCTSSLSVTSSDIIVQSLVLAICH